jgi:hypothetical protein
VVSHHIKPKIKARANMENSQSIFAKMRAAGMAKVIFSGFPFINDVLGWFSP